MEYFKIKNKFIISIIVLFLMLYIYITLFPKHILFLDKRYRIPHKMMKRAHVLYQQGKYKESFELYKRAIKICDNHYWHLKKHIFYSMNDDLKSEEYYYEFLEDIMQKQYIEKLGRNYEYSVDNPWRLATYMMDADTSRTITYFSKHPEFENCDEQELRVAWDIVMEDRDD